MAQRFLTLCLALSLYLGSLISPVGAWNPPGHMTVALVAYDLLDQGTKDRALALLHAHPRFADHFGQAQERNAGKLTDPEKDQWLFAFAATWADVVRSPSSGAGSREEFRSVGVTREDVDQFNRPWWHFIDEPVFLSEAEHQKLEGTVHVNLKRDPPADPDDKNMNVIQAIKNSTRIVADKNAPAEKRSVHLCWLLHLVGDAHQPLHSSALFTSGRFPEGDHGGNYLFFCHDYNLHAFWDDQISTEQPYLTVRNLAGALSKNAELAAAGEKAAANLDPGAWIDEGNGLAKKYVYAPEVIAKIAAREGHPHLGDLDPAPSYEVDAANVSEQQAVTAGHRLAKLLTQILQ